MHETLSPMSPNPSPISWKTLAQLSPLTPPTPFMATLQRRRDGGFWTKFNSPGGTNYLKKRKTERKLKFNTCSKVSNFTNDLIISEDDESSKENGIPVDYIGTIKLIQYDGEPRSPVQQRQNSREECLELSYNEKRSPIKRYGKLSSLSEEEISPPVTYKKRPSLPDKVLFDAKYSTLPKSLHSSVKSLGDDLKYPEESSWLSRVISPGKYIKDFTSSPSIHSDYVNLAEGEAKKQRGLSLRRLNRTRGSDITHSNTDLQKINKDAASTPASGLSRVTLWSTSFEKLLQDPAGLHTFAEFLKKEFSSENIYFWTACERYKNISNDQERKIVAKRIFDRHLASGAQDPVNIEAQVRPTPEKLHEPDEFLFSAAQKKIYELMNFDSYRRFLKSELYKSCLSHELKGLSLPFPGDDSLDPDLRILFPYSPHLKKSKSDADERRRKSLLPWHRKDRSKSKDRGEAEYRRRKKAPSDSSSIRSDITDSFTSLNSSDFAGCRAISKESISSCEAAYVNGDGTTNLCRVILPDQSNSVLAAKPGQTVKSVIKQLLDRRRVNFSTFNVITIKGEKALELSKDSSILGGLEVRIERMILFSLLLPSRKTVYVKAKPHKLVSEVLKPILSKYGYKLDNMFVYRFSDMNQVNIKGPVSEMDGEKFVAHPKEDLKERTASNNNLDDITNRIFEDLLSGKAHSFDDLGVLDFDARSLKTDISSGSSKCNMNRKENISMDQDNPSLSVGARRRNNSFSKQQEKELYEGLKRAQKSRLDDQRGTEINFELPDFLKSEIPKMGPGRGDFISQEHPEVWGSISEEEENTLLGSTDMDETIQMEDCSESQRNKPKKSLPSSPYLTPPPLPPKPKIGGVSRGPPPRPPSRHPVDPPVRVTTRNVDKFSVSFV